MIVEEQLSLDLEPNIGWDPRIHSAKCGDLVRAYLIVCQRFVLVYDTLLGPRSGGWLRQQALELGSGRPLMVVNSHADWDHFFGNMSFPDTIVASRCCRNRILGDVGAGELAKKRAEHPDCYKPVSLVGPTIAVDGETVLDGGDLRLHLLPTLGHRPDHLALFIPEISTLFPGDCVEDPIPLVDEDSTARSKTIGELASSLQRMLDLHPSWVLANHAAPERGTGRITSNLQYLRGLARQASKAADLEALGQALPASPDWGEFYRKAHLAQVKMAWQQREQEIR